MATPEKKGWTLQSQMKEMKAWLSTPGQEEFQWNDARRTIASELSSPNDDTLASISVDLEQLHAWKSTQGAVAVLDGNTSGWRDLGHGFAFGSCKVQIALGNYIDRRKPKKKAECDVDLPLVLAAAITLRQDAFADWCGRILVESYVSGAGPFRDWKLTPVSVFVTLLYARWRAINTSNAAVTRKLGPYEGFFSYWEELDKLPDVLAKACDYHLANTRYTESRVTEFEEYPYNVFPIELLAYQRVRRELGAPILDVAHPLLDNPLAKVPNKIPPFKDELLSNILTLLREQLPSTGLH